MGYDVSKSGWGVVGTISEPVEEGVDLSAWKQLLGTDLVSTTISDPDSRTTTGTGVVDGLFSLVMAGDTSVYDGFQENLPRWVAPIQTIYPDFNYATDSIDVLVLSNGVALSTSGYAVGVAILNTNATAGSAEGRGVYLRSLNASNHQNAVMGPTGLLAPSTSIGASGDGAFMGRFYWGTSTTPSTITSTAYFDGTAWRWSAGGSASGSMGNTIANWHLHIVGLHFASSTATPTMTLEVFTRLVRGSFSGVHP